MAEIINIHGDSEIIFDLEDLFQLIGLHMGDETRKCLEEMISERYVEVMELETELEQQEREIEEIREYYTGILRDLRELSEELADLITKTRLDRKKISGVAGEIGRITWEHL